MPSYTVPDDLRKAGYGIAHMSVRGMYSLYRNGRWLDDDKDPQKLILFAEHHQNQRLNQKPVKRKLAKAPTRSCSNMPTKSTHEAAHVDETPVSSARPKRIRSERAVTESARASADSPSSQVVPHVSELTGDDKDGAGVGAAGVRQPSVRPRRLPTTRVKVTPAKEDGSGSTPTIATVAEAGETPCHPLQLSKSDKGESNSVDARKRPITPLENPLPLPSQVEAKARERARLALERLPAWQLHDQTVKPKVPVEKIDVEELVGFVPPLRENTYGPERVIQVIRALVDGRSIATIEEIGFSPEAAKAIAELYGHHVDRIRGLRPFEVTDYYRLLYAALAGTTVKDLSTPNRQGQKNSLSAGGQYKSRRAS